MARRIGQSSTGEHYEFEPTEEEWVSLEQAIKAKFSAEERGEIKRIVDDYFEWEPYERHAAFTEDVENYLDQISTAAKAFWKAPQRAARNVSRDTKIAGQSLLKKAFNDPRLGTGENEHRSKLELLGGVMTSFVCACDQALREVREGEGFVEGRAWKIMVRSLSHYLARRGFRTGAPHTEEAASAAPFITFFKALQAIFPAELQRHRRATDHSLAKQISRARAKPKRDNDAQPLRTPMSQRDTSERLQEKDVPRRDTDHQKEASVDDHGDT